MLTQQLRELESRGLIERQVHDGVTSPVSYQLTAEGRSSLAPVLQALYDWGAEHAARHGISITPPNEPS